MADVDEGSLRAPGLEVLVREATPLSLFSAWLVAHGAAEAVMEGYGFESPFKVVEGEETVYAESRE
jgi:hypothetical protein